MRDNVNHWVITGCVIRDWGHTGTDLWQTREDTTVKYNTIKDNLVVGGYNRRASRTTEQTIQNVYELLPRLKERENQLAMTLSGGEQQMVAIGRGLMALPHLLPLTDKAIAGQLTAELAATNRRYF